MTPKILTVDDSKMVRNVVKRLLSSYDAEVLEAENGQEGLETAAREEPNLVIIDYNMPVMDGMEMLKAMRERDALKRTPVIFLTAEASSKFVSEVARLGVRDYVVKPFDADKLLAKIQRVCPLTEYVKEGPGEQP